MDPVKVLAVLDAGPRDRILEDLGLDREDVMAVGDSENDEDGVAQVCRRFILEL